jgi:hypothetical protein
MLFSEKVTLAMIILTIVFLIISGDRGLDLFLILILIGMIIIRELIEMFASSELKVRMNLFIYIGIITFFILIIEIVVNIIIETLII